MTKVIDVFPEAIGIYEYNDNDSIKKIVENIIGKQSKVQNISGNKLIHYANQDDESILLEKDFSAFKDWIEKCAYDYVSEIMGYEIKKSIVVTNSWINICNEGGTQYPHHHANSFISGTYYINCDNDHAPLIFYKSTFSGYSMQPSIQLQVETPTRFNCNRSVPVKTGQLVLWKSHLTHGYENNKKDGRMSLSMNFMPTYISSGIYGFEIKN